MKHFVILIYVAMMFAAVLCGPANADVTLPTLFSDHMVLQRQMDVAVWGTADDGEEVTVTFQDQMVSTVADSNGQWIVWLDSMPAGGPNDMTVAGDNSITLTDVQVGEVWVCSGQSNMVWKLIDSDGAEEAVADSGNYNIQLFILPGPHSIDEAKWEICDPNTSPNSYGVAFFFARELAQNIDVPIGLIEAAKGATAITHWTDAGTGHLYNEKIVPIQPYGIRGVLWYQGEWDAQSDCTAELYYEMLPLLIDNWRFDWGQGDFPFLYVQLPRYNAIPRDPGWMIVRDAQLATLFEVNTAMSCLIDLPASSIHPPNKEPVGYRLSLAARVLAYGEDIVYSGPIYNPNESSIESDEIIIGFNHIGSGLEDFGQELTGFEIAGEDANYVEAEAVIVGDTVVVSSPSVDLPVMVRYGWAMYPECNLFNVEGLPASPFMTEGFPFPIRNRYENR